MRERRRHPRVSLAVEVDLHSGSNFYAGKTRDISVGGLFVEAPVGLPQGSVVTLTLELGGSKHELPCVVVWHLHESSPSGAPASGGVIGFGVEFGALPKNTREAIDRFMRERAPMDYEVSFDDGTKPPPLPK
jgi:hypothetical protein